MNWKRPILNLFLAALLFQGCAARRGAYVAEIDAWHAERIENLTAPTGWLTLVGLHPLERGMRSFGSALESDLLLPAIWPAHVGSLFVSDSLVMFLPNPDLAVKVAGSDDPIHGWEAMYSDASGSPTRLETGSLTFYVIERGGDPYLRVKDGESKVLRDFEGIERFPFDRRWRVTARLVPADSTFKVAVPNVLGQVSDSPSPGWLEFDLMGATRRLLPIGGRDEPLFIIFGDETNGVSSYGAGRFLVTEAPAADGSVELDFNRAYSPPCAFTPYATCPLPPAGNVLPIAVTAGEKIGGESH